MHDPGVCAQIEVQLSWRNGPARALIEGYCVQDRRHFRLGVAKTVLEK